MNETSKPQQWFNCQTCETQDHLVVCQVCTEVCYKNHLIVDAKLSKFFCCGAVNHD